MLLFVAIDILSAAMLVAVLTAVWKNRKRITSLRYLIPATALLAVGRICDILLEHPSLRTSNLIGLSPGTYEIAFAAAGNIADVLGIAFLSVSFLAVVKFEKTSAEMIDRLETLLPICSYCKKYKTPENEWLPIEKFLRDTSGQKLTHGVCPECEAKIRSKYIKRQSTH